MAEDSMSQDLRARRFVKNTSQFDFHDAVEASRRAVKDSGCESVGDFLISRCGSLLHTTHLHDDHSLSNSIKGTCAIRTLLFRTEDPYFCFEPLFGVEKWGEDGLCFEWEEFLEEEKREAGSIERCMQAVGSLCRTSLRELHLMEFEITPRQLNCLFQGMQDCAATDGQIKAPSPSSLSNEAAAQQDIPCCSSRTSAASCTLECLRIWGCHENRDANYAGGEFVYATLPASLLFFSFLDGYRHRSPRLRFKWVPSRSAAAEQGGQEEEEEEEGSLDTLASLLRCTENLLQGLDIELWDIESVVKCEKDFAALALATTSNKSLRAFRFYSAKSQVLPEEFWNVVLKRNTSLTTLALEGWTLAGGFDTLFEAVAANQSLTQLSLWGCEGAWTLESILDSLEENATLHDIQLRGTPLEGNPGIRAQLDRNRIRAEIKQMRQGLTENEESAARVQPTTARLFLCGEPYAGKTTIAKSLVKLLQHPLRRLLDKDWLLYNCYGIRRPRTKGIEITCLEKKKLKIALWDLAGQPEYQCFHGYVFPDLSNRASPSLFLLVWSPFFPNTHKEKSLDDFSKELQYWLKFISSKTRRSKKFIPKLIIAITRKDQKADMSIYIRGEIDTLKSSFQGFIDLDMSMTFVIDSRHPSSMQGMCDRIFEAATDVMKSVKSVLKIQDIVCSYFKTNRRLGPLLTRKEYNEYFKKAVDIDSNLDDIIEIVTLLLNESGDFIYSASSEFVIVDTNWFCHTIMGNLIHYTGPTSAIKSRKGHGFFDENCLEDLLKEQLSNIDEKYSIGHLSKRQPKIQASKISGDQLLQLLLELNLVCKDHNSTEYLLPSNLPCDTKFLSRGINLPSQYITYVGRRLKCQDVEHTFLTLGVFPHLQVKFSNEDPSRVTLQNGIIYLNHEDGVHILIQLWPNTGSDDSIDILVSSIKDLNETLEWVKRNIINIIIGICASSKGIQGVNLVQEIICPACVIDSLHGSPQQHRRVVPLKHLQDKIERDLRGKNLCIDNELEISSDYSWPGELNTQNITNKVVHLLSSEEVDSVFKGYKHNLEEAKILLNELQSLESMEDHKEEENLNPENSLKGELKVLNDGITKKLNMIHDDVKKYGEEIKRNIYKLQDNIVDHIKRVQTFLMEGEERRLPSMWLLMHFDARCSSRRIISKIVPGLHSGELHFLCENKHNPHLPPNQVGISFSFVEEKSFLQKFLPYLQYFLKFAYVATKVSAHFLAGAEGLIPDFSQVTKDWNFSPPNFFDPEDTHDHATSSTITDFRRNIQPSAQEWMCRFLERKKCATADQIYSCFKLQRFHNKRNNHVSWLCDECIDKEQF